jgi:hypothetical protein
MMTMNQISAIAKEVMLKDGYHAPTLIVEGTKEGGILSLKHFPDDPDEKHLAMQATGYNVGKKAELGELVRVFLISEAWVSMAKSGTLPSVRPSKDPNRREVLIISSLAVDRTTALTLFHIERDAAGKVTGLTEFSPSPEDAPTMKSPLLDAFLHGFTQARKRAA